MRDNKVEANIFALAAPGQRMIQRGLPTPPATNPPGGRAAAEDLWVECEGEGSVARCKHGDLLIFTSAAFRSGDWRKVEVSAISVGTWYPHYRPFAVVIELALHRTSKTMEYCGQRQ